MHRFAQFLYAELFVKIIFYIIPAQTDWIFQYFRQLQDGHPVGRARVARVLHARLRELRESDSDVALRHVYAHKGRLFAQGDPSFEAVSRRLYALVSSRLPADQAVRMLLRPLLLPAWLERRLDPPIARLATWIMAP